MLELLPVRCNLSLLINQLIHILLVVILSISVVLEFHAYYIKTTKLEKYQSESISLGNWIVYLARILNMVFALFLAAAFEFGFVLKLTLIFLFGFLWGSIACFFYVQSDKFERILNAIFGRLFFFNFSNLSRRRYWRPTKNRWSHMWLLMIVSTVASYLALIVPFFLVRHHADYRMSAVYVSQFFNFGSALLLISIVEPYIMKQFDQDSRSVELIDQLDGLVLSRMWSSGLLALACAFWLVVFS